MRPVLQEDPTGCGIASVAALAGVSYSRAKARAKRLGISVEDPRLWSETKYVRMLLEEFGISGSKGERRFRSWESLPGRALLAVKWHLENGRPFWHWVVFARDGGQAWVLDPKKGLKSNRRTDFGRMKPRWFIAVSLPLPGETEERGGDQR